MTIREIKPNSREDTCKNCPELDVNYNSDESYCNLADSEEVRLKRGQHRPEWCPLKEQEKLVDVDALREKLGLAKDCAKCKQNTRACQYDSHFSLMDFCERFDMAIEELMQEGR